jgi:uncharacterized glyoxalase superfamily protein PhnB
MSDTKVVTAIPVLPCSDVRTGVDYYVQKLGFTEKFCHGEPASYAGVERDGVIIHLCLMNDAKYIASQTMLRFAVQNVDALYEEVKAGGAVHPNGALSEKPWGSREFGALDADGVCIAFYEHK